MDDIETRKLAIPNLFVSMVHTSSLTPFLKNEKRLKKMKFLCMEPSFVHFFVGKILNLQYNMFEKKPLQNGLSSMNLCGFQCICTWKWPHTWHNP
jgi:hypothetical protein